MIHDAHRRLAFGNPSHVLPNHLIAFSEAGFRDSSDVGAEQQFGCDVFGLVQKGMVPLDGFMVERVQSGHGQTAALQGIDKSLIIDQLPAGCVDEISPRFHFLEKRSIAHVLSLFCHGKMEADDVAG